MSKKKDLIPLRIRFSNFYNQFNSQNTNSSNSVFPFANEIADLQLLNIIDANNNINVKGIIDFNKITKSISIKALNQTYASLQEFLKHTNSINMFPSINEPMFTSRFTSYFNKNALVKELGHFINENDINQEKLFVNSQAESSILIENNDPAIKSLFDKVCHGKNQQERNFEPDTVITYAYNNEVIYSSFIEYKFNYRTKSKKNITLCSKYIDILKNIIYLIKYPQVNSAIFISSKHPVEEEDGLVLPYTEEKMNNFEFELNNLVDSINSNEDNLESTNYEKANNFFQDKSNDVFLYY